MKIDVAVKPFGRSSTLMTPNDIPHPVGFSRAIGN
jgi:hypothetical protein